MPRLQVNGKRVNCRRQGSGQPVILLHSSSSHSGQWRHLSDRLNGRYTTLAPDFFGYGKSDPLPDDGRPYHHHDVQIVAALLDESDGPAHLVGHSLGATIALRAALQRTDRVASLTLIEPVLFNLLEETRDPRRLEYLELAHAMTVLVRFGRDREAALLFLDFWIGPGAFDALDDDRRNYVVSTIGRVADDWYGISSHAPDPVRLGDLAGLSTPTLIVCGKLTRPSARGIVEALKAAIPHAEYRDVEGAGHMSPITHPHAVNELVADFLARHAA